MIVESFDNAWHVLRYWRERGYDCFVLDQGGRVPRPRPCRGAELGADERAGLDYFPIPPALDPELGDNPDPDRPLTAAEILLATAIAEGWEPDTKQ
ncbi:MAG TPA: hypothetical protein VF546_12210 [Pyrinomonadaceae bacterium]|jgi:hypothetical protein